MQYGLNPCMDGRSTRSVSSLPEVAGGRTGGKGLRHFSMKVCEKVESKGRTTYNEVADELVKDFSSPEMTGASLSEPMTMALRVNPGANCYLSRAASGRTASASMQPHCFWIIANLQQQSRRSNSL